MRFRRLEGQEALQRYTTGRLTELPHQTWDTLAQAVPGTSVQRWQEFLTNMPWDEEHLNRQRMAKMVAEAARGDGVLVFDETGFPKQGKTSVGVARQDAGILGNVGHGQMAVTCCDSEPGATWPVAVRLYLSKTGADDARRRQQAHIPAEVPFQTKPEIALALVGQARAWGVPHRCVVADADDGDHPPFLGGLEARPEPSVVAVRADFAVRVGGTATSPAWRADELLPSVPRWQWRPVRWRRQKFVAVRGGRVTRDGARHEGWLVGERATQGQPKERPYFWRTLTPGDPSQSAGQRCPSATCDRTVPRRGEGGVGLGPV